jgi:hypothetical protein
MGEAHVHTTTDLTSAEAAAGRLRADGIPARVAQEGGWAGGPQPGEFRVLVPEDRSRAARRSLGVIERGDPVDRRGFYAVIVLALLALVVFALGLAQRVG